MLLNHPVLHIKTKQNYWNIKNYFFLRVYI